MACSSCKCAGNAYYQGPDVPPGNERLIGLPLLIDRYGWYGMPDATLDRASGSTIQDFKGITREIQVHEFGFEGARRVENKIINQDVTLWSHSSRVSVYGGVSDPQGCNSAYTVIATDATGLTANIISSLLDANTDVVHSIWIRRRSGTGIVNIYNCGNGSSTTDVTAALTNSWQRVSGGSQTITTASSNFIGVQVITAGDSIDIWTSQIEDVTGQSNQAPSEFIEPNDSACSQFDIPVRYFDTTNGNTVDANGVVTEAPGVYLGIKGVDAGGTMQRLQVWEESENLAQSSNDLTLWTGSSATIDAYNQVSFTASIAARIYVGGASMFNETTHTFLLKAKMIGAATGEIGVRLGGGAVAAGPTVFIAITDELKSYSVQVETGASDNTRTEVINGSAGVAQIVQLEDIQCEELTYPTPLIPTNGAAASRVATDAQVVWPDGLVNDFVMSCDANIKQGNGSGKYILDASNSVGSAEGAVMLQSGGSTSIIFGTQVGTFKAVTYTSAINDGLRNFLQRNSATAGLDGFVDKTKGTTNTNTADATAGTDTVYIGQRWNKTAHLNSTIGNISVISGDMALSDITLDASTLELADGDPVNSLGFLTSSNPPKYNTNVQNGLDVIRFDGAANEMNGALTVSMVQFSYYIVMKYGTHEDNAGIMSVGPTGGNDWDNDNGVNFAVHGGASNSNQVAIRRGNTDNILAQWGIPPVLADFFLLEGHIDTVAGTFSGRVNGGAEFTDTFDHLTPIDPDIFVLGCRALGGVVAAPYSDMTFGEARLYNRLIPETDRRFVRQEMMKKWGL